MAVLGVPAEKPGMEEFAMSFMHFSPIRLNYLVAKILRSANPHPYIKKRVQENWQAQNAQFDRAPFLQEHSTVPIEVLEILFIHKVFEKLKEAYEAKPMPLIASQNPDHTPEERYNRQQRYCHKTDYWDFKKLLVEAALDVTNGMLKQAFTHNDLIH